jgi:uncharacterized membrane protein
MTILQGIQIAAQGIHSVAVVILVGGLFRGYMAVSPMSGDYTKSSGLQLAQGALRRFFPWVWVSILVLPVTGYVVMFATYGSFAAAPLYINLMQAISWVMIALFAWLFFVPWREFKFHIDAEKWSAAGANLARIDKINLVNLLLGIIAVVTGSTGPYWQ